MTIRQALQHAAQLFTLSDTATLDAQVLLSTVLEVNRAYLLAHDDEVLSTEHTDTFLAYVQRRAEGDPIPYILGTRGFYDLEFMVTPAVLIPRPETELLLEEALRLMKTKPNCVVADIGTGSGALAVTFAKHMPHSIVYATDISDDALTVARQNADQNNVTVTYYQGNLAQPLIDHHIKLDLLMANLPYIRSDDMSHLQVSQHEPHLALDGGDDGLDFIRELLQQIPQVCKSGAIILLEIGAEQGNVLKSLVRETLDVSCDLLQDYAGLDRIGRIRL